MSKIKLSKKYIYKICKEALKEDLYPSGDITSELLNNTNKIKAKIVSNSSGIIGGLDLAKQTFKIRWVGNTPRHQQPAVTNAGGSDLLINDTAKLAGKMWAGHTLYQAHDRGPCPSPE